MTSRAPHPPAGNRGVGLLRAITRWDLVALLINGIVGAGIFGLPSRVHALLGSWALVAYLACAGLVLLIVLCFAEVGSRYERTGGPYVYASEAFGPWIGFQVGWLAWLSRVSAFAALCHLFVDYLGHFVPGVVAPLPRAGVVAAIVLGLGAINWVGVRHAARVGDAFTVAKLLPLLFFVGVGAFYVEPAALALRVDAIPTAASFSAAVLLLVFAFTGFESAVVPAGESRDPRRDLPFGLLVALGVVAPLYLAIQAVSIGTLPTLADSTRPLADAAAGFLGPNGAALIALGALVSILGTLHGILLAAPRMLYAMAERDQLPRALAQTHPRFRTPHAAILAMSLVLLALALDGSFLTAVAVSTVARLLVYAATCAALPVLRRREGVQAARFRVPAGELIAGLALILVLWLLAQASARELIQVGVAMLIGVIVLAVTARLRRAPSHA